MRRRPLLCMLTTLSFPGAAHPTAAASDTILTLQGQVRHGRQDFSLAALEALGLEHLATVTPWTHEVQSFSGVTLARLLRAAGADARARLRAEALNRYGTELQPEDAAANGALLATRLDGTPMRVRDRGPLWLVFPWSQRPDLASPQVYERSIWQLRRIEIG